MAYTVMTDKAATGGHQGIVVGYIVIACIVMAYIVMAFTVMTDKAATGEDGPTASNGATCASAGI